MIRILEKALAAAVLASVVAVPAVQAQGARAWSLEMISVPDVRYRDNPINRYVIDSRMPGLKSNPDGSLEIAIQRESPGPELESNWLPSPDAGFSLTLRLYAPKQAAIDGTWKPAYPNRLP